MANNDQSKSNNSVIVSEVTEEPRVTSKQLKVSLTLAVVCIAGLLGDSYYSTKMNLFTKRPPTSHFTKDYVDKPEGWWRNVLWTR